MTNEERKEALAYIKEWLKSEYAMLPKEKWALEMAVSALSQSAGKGINDAIYNIWKKICRNDSLTMTYKDGYGYTLAIPIYDVLEILHMYVERQELEDYIIIAKNMKHYKLELEE